MDAAIVAALSLLGFLALAIRREKIEADAAELRLEARRAAERIDTYECLNCLTIAPLDRHWRCFRCGSDAVFSRALTYERDFRPRETEPRSTFAAIQAYVDGLIVAKFAALGLEAI